MKKAFFQGLMAFSALAVATVALATPAQAAGTKYTFIAKVVVTHVDQAAKTFKADVKKVEGRGKDDMGTRNIEFTIDSKAKILKVSNGVDKAVTYKNIAIGQELGIKGYAKSDDNDTFVVTFVRIHERSFTLFGLLQSINKTAKTMKISVLTSSYKPQVYKQGDEITVNYNDDSTFYENNAERAVSDINADSQRMKLMGRITDTNTWLATRIWNKHKGN